MSYSNPDSFSLQPIFDAATTKLDFSLQLSLRTTSSITVEKINIGDLYLDLPAFDFTVGKLTNATHDCKTPPPGTPPDQIYADLIHLGGSLDAALSYKLLSEDEKLIDTWPIYTAFDKCYAFFPGLGRLGVVPESPKAPLLHAAAVTTCTTGGKTTTGLDAATTSLSPGVKAGAVLGKHHASCATIFVLNRTDYSLPGTLLGVSIIAALAWYAGRASAHRRNRDQQTASGWNTPRPRFGKLFSQGSRGGAKDTATFTPSTDGHWHSPAYTGGYFPSPDSEAQQQLKRQSWQMAKKEPMVATGEVMTPSTGYVSLRNEQPVSTPEPGETSAVWDTESPPMSYKGFAAGPAEGLGLLQGNRRSMGKLKELPRKPVRGHRSMSGSP